VNLDIRILSTQVTVSDDRFTQKLDFDFRPHFSDDRDRPAGIDSLRGAARQTLSSSPASLAIDDGMFLRPIICFMMRYLYSLLLSAVCVLGSLAAPADTLPLGDGRISSAPASGSVYACQTRFQGGGAHGTGSWIQGNTWDPNAKPTVDGAVRWPDASIHIQVEGDRRIVRANNLPVHTTGRFPISPSDDSYRYDRNPNSIRAQSVLLDLPALPTLAARPSCVPMGMIGFSLTGAALYNALDGMGRDAPAHEIQDTCQGHPQRSGQYHYHDNSPCMIDKRSAAGGHSDLVAYALDGFGIYGLYGSDRKPMTNASLDACHGHSHRIDWDGQSRELYHYHMSKEYPYSIGCFRGQVSAVPMGTAAPAGGRQGQRQQHEAILRAAAAELGVSERALREAVGPPPPDFARAARQLGVPEEKLRRVMHNARQGAMRQP
jgi:hypothetical protein